MSLEVTAIDEELTLQIGEDVLDEAGQSLHLGETPEIHGDVVSQLALPGGPPSGEYEISFRLRTRAAAQSRTPVGGDQSPRRVAKHALAGGAIR